MTKPMTEQEREALLKRVLSPAAKAFLDANNKFPPGTQEALPKEQRHPERTAQEHACIAEVDASSIPLSKLNIAKGAMKAMLKTGSISAETAMAGAMLGHAETLAPAFAQCMPRPAKADDGPAK